jgi:hypothetical protein
MIKKPKQIPKRKSFLIGWTNIVINKKYFGFDFKYKITPLTKTIPI